MTRCEAYLDSKGFLRWWARDKGPLQNDASPSGRDGHAGAKAGVGGHE
jgi:hypothetical protein